MPMKPPTFCAFPLTVMSLVDDVITTEASDIPTKPPTELVPYIVPEIVESIILIDSAEVPINPPV